MPHVQVIGTAWDRCFRDYAFTRDLDHTGWAWEFLRRNPEYQRDYCRHRTQIPIAVTHGSGATLYRSKRRFLEAEVWGLVLFTDPARAACEADIFWLPDLITVLARCHSKVPGCKALETFSLESFHGRRAIFAGPAFELICLSEQQLTANLIIEAGTLLRGQRSLVFFHDGIKTAIKHNHTLRVIKQFCEAPLKTNGKTSGIESKFLFYLIALDGHLNGRTYREIAQVLYGADRVRQHWTDDTRWMKSKVRRAVERGIALMNGSYRDLL